MTLQQRAEQIKNETQANANTAERVGGLFEDVVKDYSGRLSYGGNGSESVSLTAGEPVQITGIWNASREENVVLNDNTIEAVEAGAYKCYGMITVKGSQNKTYELQLRKNGNLICSCNPITETPQGRKLNIVSFDVETFATGDELSLWLVGSATEVVDIERAKLVMTK